MKFLSTALAVSAFAALAACGGDGDDAMGEQVQESYENQADSLDAMADNTSGTAEDSLEAQADALREEGERKEEAIDDSDVDADAMTPAEQNNLANSM